MTAKNGAIILGAIFLLTGVLGFIPNPIVSPTGLFSVNAAHNIVHLASGVFLFAGAYMWLGTWLAASLALKIVGVIYAAVAVIGLVSGPGMLLGLILTNHADHWLHVFLVLLIAAFAFL
ncbi:DUF4383 domain-containing protein [Bradyrhizobium sp.]|uniref:DUF4383 domain-containing protein n=1 Tax=Bradyrhizobium sp. TaxID=376 RepID=UPI003C74ABA4